jgi:signal transduction histidine kinase
MAFDPRVVERDGLFDVAVASVRAVLENQRLAAEVRRQVEELQESRARIAAAGWAERRQVERDLHDGAQQQFLAVAATLAQVDLAPDDELRPMVVEARQRLREGLAELRRLARGIHPAALSQGGLAAALPALCAATPTRCDLDIDTGLGAGRLDATVESAAYFVVAEAVTNAVKHAAGASIRISVRTCGDVLEADVSDTGPGGTRVEPGGGIAGLRDRVEAVGGHLDVHSDPCVDHPASHGSTVSARLPLRPH